VVHTVSGAAANCKIECTIAQDDKSVTISLPADAKGMKPRDTLLLFAGEMEAVSSRPQTDAYRAKWEGDRLVVSNSVAFVSITQQLFIENGQLTIASKVNNPDGTTHSAVFVYARK